MDEGEDAQKAYKLTNEHTGWNRMLADPARPRSLCGLHPAWHNRLSPEAGWEKPTSAPAGARRGGRQKKKKKKNKYGSSQLPNW
eukprot:6670776-Pyramimonas_sp.AAC.3